MAIPEGGEIGETESKVSDGDFGIVPSGVFHNFRCTGAGMLKLFTTCSPPEHEPGTEHATKADADD